MVAVLKPITQRVIQRPQYVNADTFDMWHRLNQWRLWDRWVELNPNDDEGTSSEFLDFVKVQWDLYRTSAEETDDEAEPASRRFRTDEDAAAYDAGVPSRGEI